MQRLIRHAFLVASALAWWSSGALAQSNARELTVMNRAAMDAYTNLDIDSAKAQLEAAVAGAERNGVGGPALARAYLNLGVIYVGGYGDNGRGMSYFIRALRIDPTVQLDPLVSTPDIQQVFALAQRKAGGGGRGRPAPAPRQPLPQVTAETAGPAEGNLVHVPALEQLSQTALPVYVEAPPDLDVDKMRIFYRSLGMQKPKTADMDQVGDGWGYLIPCTDVFEPSVEYFVVALNDDEEQIGNAGTPQNPISVPIVSERSQPAPSLPGQIPPSQCTGAAECPPGMPGCGGGGGLGDTCRTDADCGQGLTCDDNFCAVGDGSSGRAGPRKGARFFFNLGMSVGFAYVKGGMDADSTPPKSVLDERAGAAIRAANAQRACDLGGACPEGVDRQDFDSAAFQASINEAARNGLADAAAKGWDCSAVVSPALTETDWTDPNVQPADVTLTNCAVAVSTPGLVPTLALRATGGAFLTERLSLAGTVRYQFNAGEGNLAGILIGARLGYLVTEPSATGLYATVFAGGSVGQIQPQPKSQVTSDGPHVIGGLGGVQVGAMVGYRFLPNVGIGVTPEVHFLLPTFLFNIDITPVVNIAF